MSDALLLLFATAIACLLVSIAGGRAIHFLRRICPERIDTASPRLAGLHATKAGTPSMGGLLIFGAWLAVVGLVCDFRQRGVLTAVAATCSFAALGACDDLIKARGCRRGLSARAKLSGQLAISVAVVLGALATGVVAAPVHWLIYVPLVSLLITGMSNAVNVTDGLDGLASGCGALVAIALTVTAELLPSSDAFELGRNRQVALLAAVLTGSLLGFVRFNRSPARVFMGDTGSLPLGGLLALLAVLLQCEALFLLIGGVFLIELGSVVLQVTWYRSTGHRLFRCAPLHHHFEFLGWPELTIVRRFWAAAACFAVAGLLLVASNDVHGHRRTGGVSLPVSAMLGRVRPARLGERRPTNDTVGGPVLASSLLPPYSLQAGR
ncbi:MAG TPA: phospho-N-acetylmuramoyl-pentapeptide-transferase [Pirellulales bacterium]|nr:phospho-N-acetylmuramoyl-pentapeptide-transferase [Pirellulales bacterium]